MNSVGPAHTDTEMLAEVGRSRPEVMKQWLEDIPLHRVMQPREVADAVVFLLSGAASAITWLAEPVPVGSRGALGVSMTGGLCTAS